MAIIRLIRENFIIKYTPAISKGKMIGIMKNEVKLPKCPDIRSPMPTVSAKKSESKSSHEPMPNHIRPEANPNKAPISKNIFEDLISVVNSLSTI